VAGVAGVLLGVSALAPAAAHHVGVFTPRDDDITKNFKEIKFASQAGRFDVALRLFDEGVVHATMERFEKQLPAGLEDGLRAALKTKSLPGVELRLALFLAFMTRERVRSADAKLQEPGVEPEQRREQARKILTAAWRYYNLADFVFSRQNPKAAVALRMAFEDAQSYLGGTLADPMWAPGANPCSPRPVKTGVGPDVEKARAALVVMERTLGEVIGEGALVVRKGGAKEFLPRR
jgi:hypothetical protein